MNTCVYFHINPIKQEIFYVGIGTLKRPYLKNGRSNAWLRIVSKYGYDVIIIHNNLSWDDACALEIKYIKQIGRMDLGQGSLTNFTNGGDGTIGISDELRKKLSESHKGIRLSEAAKKKISEFNIGRKKGNIIPDDIKQKISDKLQNNKNAKGSVRSIEYKRKKSENLKGKPWTEQRRSAELTKKNRKL